METLGLLRGSEVTVA